MIAAPARGGLLRASALRRPPSGLRPRVAPRGVSATAPPPGRGRDGPGASAVRRAGGRRRRDGAATSARLRLRSYAGGGGGVRAREFCRGRASFASSAGASDGSDADASGPEPKRPSDAGAAEGDAAGRETTRTTTTSAVSFESSIKEQLEWNRAYQRHDSFRPSSLDEADRHIKRRQELAAKLSREKTSANIRRALTGNLIIALAKLGAWQSSGSSAMLSEFVHSLVDCGNQALLLMGLRDAAAVADRTHPYGYGKSVYFWALVSALGTFWLGAGVTLRHSLEELADPSLADHIAPEVWAVLAVSLSVDGYVWIKTVQQIRETMDRGRDSFWTHVGKLRDPATLAIFLEDGAACAGVVIAGCGIGLSHFYGNPVFDGLAGVGVSFLLAGMGVVLVRLNRRFLLGQAVDPEIVADIEAILLSQSSIDNVHSVQSQWTGPDTFSYKAEVDFDGTYLAAKLMPRYQKEFASSDPELRVLLSWYAEDVMRTVEREVRHIEAQIRKKHPGAAYIELEPDSRDSERFAIDDGVEAQLKRIERENITRLLKNMAKGVTDAMTNKKLAANKDALSPSLQTVQESKQDNDAKIIQTSSFSKKQSSNTAHGENKENAIPNTDNETVIVFHTDPDSKNKPQF